MLRPALCCFLSTMMSVLLPFEAQCAPAQQAAGGITGVVRDERGAVVPEARVTLTWQDSQRQELVLSGADGEFTLQPLPEGGYTITVAKAGFAPLRLKGIVVKPGQSTQIQPVLSTSDLRQQLLLIPAGTVVVVLVQQKGIKKITGKLGLITDEGFEVQTVKSGKVSFEKIAFADVESMEKRGMSGATRWLLGVATVFGILVIAMVARCRTAAANGNSTRRFSMTLRIVVGIILAAPWLVHPSRAQEPPAPEWNYTAEAFGNFALGRFYHGDHVWGSGLDYGGGFGVRPFPGKLHRLGFEVQLARLKTSGTRGSSFSQELDSRLVMGNVLYHFRNGAKTQPYVFGGLGHVKVNYASSSCGGCVYYVPDPVTGEVVPRVDEERIIDSKIGITFGVGVKASLFRHVSIRPELLFVDTTPGSGWNWGWVRLQLGVGAHF